MKISLLLLAMTPSILLSTMAHSSNIEFEISGINSNKGKLYIQLFKGEKNYLQGKSESASIVKAAKGSTKILFNNVDEGEYALRFFHDENDNGELESNLFGMPIEGYGFSNNAVPNFGPVSYKEIKFVVSPTDTKVVNKTSVIY